MCDLRGELGFELELVDIGGRAELESRYRELLPVVEVDGEVAFTYVVDRDSLCERVLTVRPARSNEPQAES